VLIRVYLLAGRYVTRWYGKRRTVYGITTDRILVQRGSSFRESPVKGARRQCGVAGTAVTLRSFSSPSAPTTPTGRQR
jgi:hypothetical protein